MAFRTVGCSSCTFARPYVVLGACTAKLVFATRSDGFFGWLVADVTHKHILAAFCTLFEEKVWVVGNLAHLHDQAKDICIVVEHDSTRHISVKGTSSICHDAGREITLDLAEELVVYDNFLGRQFLRILDVPYG
jgi:hypothetical protein